MSNRAQAWAICQRTGSPTRKLVLTLLADLADEQFTCYPGREYLADRAELTPRAVSTALTALAAAGLVRVLRRAKRNGGRRSNRYLLMVLGPDTPLPDVADWSGEFAPVDLAEDPQPQGRAGDTHDPDPHGSPAGGGAGQGNREARSPLPAGPGARGGNGEPGSPPTGNDVPASHKEERSTRGVPPPPNPPGTTGATAVLPAEGEDDPDHDPYPGAAAVIGRATAGLPWDAVPRPRQAAHLTTLAAEAITAGWTPDALTAALTADSLYGVQSVYAVLRYRLADLGPPPPLGPVQAVAARVLPARGPWCGEPHCDPTTRQRLDADGRPLRATAGGFVHCACCESH